jgi:hypothetical protein
MSSVEPLILVSDGGINRYLGSYSAVIGTCDQDNITPKGITHGDLISNSSFHSEALGMLSASSMVNSLLTYFEFPIHPEKKINLYKDNIGPVQRLEKHPKTAICSS